MARNFRSDGRPKLGRPPGPMSHRGARPWDRFNLEALCIVAANPDLERYRIAEYLGISASTLSTITCSPRGRAQLERIRELPAEDLAPFRLKLSHDERKT